MPPRDHAATASRWPTYPLADVATLFVGLPTTRHLAPEEEQGVEEWILSVGDLQDGRIVHHNVTKVRLKPGAAERFRVRLGDVVLACRGTLLKSARVTEESEGIIASSNLIVIRPSPTILPAILVSLFRSSSWKSTLQQRARSSTGLMQFTVKDIKDLPVPLPPMVVQADLADIIDAEESHHIWALAAAERRREMVVNTLEHILLKTSKRSA